MGTLLTSGTGFVGESLRTFVESTGFAGLISSM